MGSWGLDTDLNPGLPDSRAMMFPEKTSLPYWSSAQGPA